MTAQSTWHAGPDLLAAYVADGLGRAAAASVEAHLLACPSCRAAIATLAPPERLARNLAAIHDRVDDPRPHPIERLLQGLGVPDRITRVLLVTPSARSAWLAAVSIAVALAVLADLSGVTERTLFAFLVAAPLLPMAAVTATFASRGDPLRELLVAAPTPAFDLLLMRAVAVLAPTVLLVAVASALVPGQGTEPLLWLLPSLGLATATLALGSWFPVRPVAWALGGGWVATALISVRGAPRTDLIERFAAFRPGGQLALLALALVAGAVVAVRRDTFDVVHAGRPS
jgi:hypothetical protein